MSLVVNKVNNIKLNFVYTWLPFQNCFCIDLLSYHVDATQFKSDLRRTLYICLSVFQDIKHVLEFLNCSFALKLYIVHFRPTYHCNMCNFTTGLKTTLHLHQKTHSKPLKTCQICDFSTVEKYLFIKHMQKMHGTPDQECDYCDKKFFTLGDLQVLTCLISVTVFAI